MYETYNYLINYLKNNKNMSNLENNYKKILICFSPVIPHFSSECLNEIGISNYKWPEYDEKLIQNDKIKIVIQINGKKRALLDVEKGIEKSELLEIIRKDKNLEKYLVEKEIKKVIFVENRLMNILINE